MISTIIPTYNRTELLMDRCLPSVFAQTVDDQEILVIGDGTERATVKAMRSLKGVRFWNLPHTTYPDDPVERWGLIGLVPLNFGLDHAKGEWIAVLADDDEWTPDHHEALLAESEGVDHVYGVSIAYKQGREVGKYGQWPPGGDGQIANGANLYRASLGYRYDLRCRELRERNGDADLWDRMVEDGVSFRFVDKVVHHYYRNYP